MRSLRFLVACMLLLAIPLQGMAAASMLFCGVQQQAAAGPAHPHDDGSAAMDHHHGPDAGMAHEHAASAGHHAPGKLSDLNCAQACSVCAASCHGAVISESPSVLAFSVPTYVPAPASTVALRVRALPPPDKPPRA